MGKITYPFPNFKGCTVEAWQWIDNFNQHFTRVITYPSLNIETCGHFLTSCHILRDVLSGILIKMENFPLMKMHLKMSSVRCRPFYLGHNKLMGLEGISHVLTEQHRSDLGSSTHTPGPRLGCGEQTAEKQEGQHHENNTSNRQKLFDYFLFRTHVQLNNKGNVKAPHHWPFVRSFIKKNVRNHVTG